MSAGAQLVNSEALETVSTGLYLNRGKDKDETSGMSDLCSPVPQWIGAVGLTNKSITSVQRSLFPRQFYLLSPSISPSLLLSG